MIDYDKMMSKRQALMKSSLQLDYDKFELEGIAFDYEKMMDDAGYTFEEVQKIQIEI